jgi:hypothetical protein
VKNHIHEWNTFISWFINWKVLLFIVTFFCLLTHFFIICIYLEIEFIKPLDDVKIQRKIIIFTKDYENRTVFINKMINSGIMRMFIFLYNFTFICSILFAKCYAFAQIIVVFLVWEIFFFLLKWFYFFFVFIIFYFYV